MTGKSKNTHEEDGSLAASVDFDYPAVDRNLFGIDEEDLRTLAGLTEKEREAAFLMLDFILRWGWQNGSLNENGLVIRFAILCWVFLKELQPLSETDLARIFGKDKQSFGRWVEQFKGDFPFIQTPHIRRT